MTTTNAYRLLAARIYNNCGPPFSSVENAAFSALLVDHSHKRSISSRVALDIRANVF